ncbi:MAG: hypothetical protein ACKPKO_26105, partial [Candidatus Fonsibacter sp.]
MLEKARSNIEHITKNKVGESAAKTIANELTVKHVVEYRIQTKQTIRGQCTTIRSSIISTASKPRHHKAEPTGNHDAALNEEKWRLEPALKRARLYESKVAMKDVKRWRVENY